MNDYYDEELYKYDKDLSKIFSGWGIDPSILNIVPRRRTYDPSIDRNKAPPPTFKYLGKNWYKAWNIPEGDNYMILPIGTSQSPYSGGPQEPWKLRPENVIHNLMDAVEDKSTPEELIELQEIMNNNPPPSGGPTQRYLPTEDGTRQLNEKTLASYFDYAFGTQNEHTPQNWAVPDTSLKYPNALGAESEEPWRKVPEPILDWLRKKFPYQDSFNNSTRKNSPLSLIKNYLH